MKRWSSITLIAARIDQGITAPNGIKNNGDLKPKTHRIPLITYNPVIAEG